MCVAAPATIVMKCIENSAMHQGTLLAWRALVQSPETHSNPDTHFFVVSDRAEEVRRFDVAGRRSSVPAFSNHEALGAGGDVRHRHDSDASMLDLLQRGIGLVEMFHEGACRCFERRKSTGRFFDWTEGV